MRESRPHGLPRPAHLGDRGTRAARRPRGACRSSSWPALHREPGGGNAGRPAQRAVGRRSPSRRSSALRYPGGDRPQVQNIPARNANFTGRDKDLRQLREELRTRRMAVVLPLTIQGLGGVGKTQLALEYAHRFKADYDIIWWMNCGQAQYVDASLADLGQRLREEFGVAVPEEGGMAEVSSRCCRLLSEGLPDQRWLLIYDNAEDIEQLTALLPGGGGHVLITSQNEQLAGHGQDLPGSGRVQARG